MVSSLPGFLRFLEPILYQPLLNILIFFYYHIGDLGLAIILVTVLIKFLLYPLIIKSIRGRERMAKIQPELKKIKEKYKNEPQKQSLMIMQLFKTEKVNPFSGCLPLLLQLPILFILFFLFKDIVGNIDLTPLYYGFIPDPGEISPYFFNFINLAQPNIILALIVGGGQFLQTKTLPLLHFPSNAKISKKETSSSPQAQITAIMNKQMIYVLPVITMIFSLMLPSALALYWAVSSLFTAGLQFLYLKK